MNQANMRHIALQIALMLPDNSSEAKKVLQFAEELAVWVNAGGALADAPAPRNRPLKEPGP